MTVKTDIKFAGSPEMQTAALEAAKELPEIKLAKDVKNWISKWFIKAGYTNLCRLLMANDL